MTASATNVVLAAESLIFLAGLALLARLIFHAATRKHWLGPTSALPRWPGDSVNFLLMLSLIFSLGYGAQVAGRMGLIPFIKNMPERETWELAVLGGLFQLGGLFGAGLFYLLMRYSPFTGEKPAAPLASRPVSPFLSALGLFAAILPVVAAVSLGWTAILKSLGLPTGQQELVDIIHQTQSPALLTLLIVLATVIAPFNEELIFRAGVYRFARARLPRWAALVVSAIPFAALHLNLASFMPLFVLGAAFAFVYEKTGCLAVPILAHALFNLNTLVMLFAGIDAS